jgi:RNA polymerase primary sigma factor
LKSILTDLQERDRHVVQRFYGIGVEPRTMAEIGAEMGLKRERVRQIRDHAVRAIVKKTHNVKLKDYLRG